MMAEKVRPGRMSAFPVYDDCRSDNRTGLTKREYMATHIMAGMGDPWADKSNGIVAAEQRGSIEQVAAKLAVLLADALIEALG